MCEEVPGVGIEELVSWAACAVSHHLHTRPLVQVSYVSGGRLCDCAHDTWAKQCAYAYHDT